MAFEHKKDVGPEPQRPAPVLHDDAPNAPHPSHDEIELLEQEAKAKR